MNTLAPDTATAAAAGPLPELRQRYDAHSKHSSYQLVHPSLMPWMGPPEGLPAGKQEPQRQQVMAQLMSPRGRSVLDIGANTGYFSFAALEAGARRVVAQEGNAEHAQFLASAGQHLGAQERFSVRPSYYDFGAAHTEFFDICLCLNVLHHLGDDFGDPALSIEQARQQMLDGLNRLARTTHTLFLQIGFNWKGQVAHPLFAGGEKSALIDFVTRGTAGTWRIDDILVASGFGGAYEPLSGRNAPRDDRLGEFLNRPLFHMTSLVL